MPVCRFIFRIDYPANFEIIDSPGAIMESLMSIKKDFWHHIGDSFQDHHVSARFRSADKKTYREFTVEAKALVMDVETSDGLALNGLEQNEAVGLMFNLANSLVDEYSIDEVHRLGMRVFHLNRLGESKAEVLSAFRAITGDQLPGVVADRLGPIADYGYALDGRGADNVGYHFKCGPYDPTEFPKYFGNIDATSFSEAHNYNFICDLDLFDEKFSLAKLSPLKWCRGLVQKQANLIDRTEDLIRHNIQG